MKYTLFLLLALSSGVFADTYPAVTYYVYVFDQSTRSSTLAQVCTLFDAAINPYTFQPVDPTKCAAYLDGSPYPPEDRFSSFAKWCPGGGTISGTDCINAPACSSGQVRDATGVCGIPPAICNYPETDNGFGLCEVEECQSYELRNKITGSCYIPPVCAESESYDEYFQTCKLKVLYCPEHHHGNADNTLCVIDPPIVCATGSHHLDDWSCETDSPTACPEGYQKGFVDGNPVCGKRSDTDKSIQDANELSNQAAAVTSDYNAAQAAAVSARADANANPTDQTKQAAATAAESIASNLNNQKNDALESSIEKNTASTSKTLNEMLQKTLEAEDKTQVAIAKAAIDSTAAVVVPEELSTTITPRSGFGLNGSCPADLSFSVFGRSYSLSFAPACTFATNIRPVILSIGVLVSLGIVFSSL